MDMINIGYSGASTAQVELNVTAQNTANAMTTGYTRQVAEISTIGASGGSPNSAGNGVQVDSIRRVSNQYQVNQVWYAASDYGYYSTQQGYLTQLEAVLSDDNSSLSGGFDNFFAALNEATTSPDDSALREQVISEAGALSLRIDNTLDYVDSQSTEIISQQQAMVSQINTLTSGIASYNQQIAQAEANGDNASALYDARDQMVEELSGMMDAGQYRRPWQLQRHPAKRSAAGERAAKLDHRAGNQRRRYADHVADVRWHHLDDDHRHRRFIRRTV